MLAYNFQLKSMWADKKSFSARLLSMERLAKTPEPSFIFVIKFGPSLSVENAFLIHLGGTALDHVLKRSHAFFERVQELSQTYAAGGDYTETKRKQIETAGYSDSPVKIKVTIQGKSGTEVIDGFLGLKPLQVSSFSATEERFGFQRPFGLEFSGPGVMSFMPTGGPGCKVFFRQTRNGAPVVRAGNLIVPPIQPVSRFLATSHPITLDINLAGTLSFTIANLNSETKPLRWWKEVAQAAIILASEKFYIDVYDQGGVMLFGTEIVANNHFNRDDADWFSALLRAVDRMLSLTERVGMSDFEFSISDIELADVCVARCLAFVDEIGTSFESTFEGLSKENEELIGEPKIGVVAQSLRLGSTELMYCAVALMTMTRGQAGEPILQGVTTSQGFLESGGGVTLGRYARACAKQVGAQYLIVFGDDAGSGDIPELESPAPS